MSEPDESRRLALDDDIPPTPPARDEAAEAKPADDLVQAVTEFVNDLVEEPDGAAEEE